MKTQINEVKRMQKLAGLKEAENFLVKGDNQIIVRATDAIEMIEASLDQLIQYPTKNVVGLAKNAMDSINDLKEILKIKLKEASYLDKFAKDSVWDDEPTQAGTLSSVLRSMSDEVQEAGRELEKELKKAGVELETNGYLINAIKYLVMAAKHSK